MIRATALVLSVSLATLGVLAPPAALADVYTDAIASPARTDADRDRDTARKPGEILRFIDIGPGDVVLEMFAGGGYYTELLAGVVGEDGRVVAQMNQTMLNFTKDEFEARHADGRLPNVDVLWAENNELDLPAARFDAITMVLNYHDLYWESEQYGWVPIDIPVFMAELHRALKPGGVLGIVDHDAEPGSSPELGGDLHRIAREHAISDFEAAGFVLDAESDVLRSDVDDYSLNVFDPAVRGKTDRFVLRFVKPGD